MSDSTRSYSFEFESNKPPVAIVLPMEQQAVVGSVIKLDGTASFDPEGADLIYSWSFTQVPIGSQAQNYGFLNLEENGSVVSFAPDLIGTYKISLIVSDGSLSSIPSIANVDTRVILVPHNEGFIPDASFIWNYLSDFWTLVDNRKKIEYFWSAAIQVVSTELLKLYQYDYNKSIKDIQEVLQRRWISFSPGLPIDRTKISFVLADDQAGLQANTLVLDSSTGLPVQPQPGYTNLVAAPLSEGSFSQTSYGKVILPGRLLQLGSRSFTSFRSTSVVRSIDYALDGATVVATTHFTGSFFTSDMVGDNLRILSGTGPAAGDYPITGFIDANTIALDLTGASITNWAGSYSPIRYSVIPAVGKYSGFVSKTSRIPAGLDNQAWRFSATLTSSEYDLESLGVSQGDVIQVEISRQDNNLISTVYGQIVSVDGSSAGFVLNLSDLVDGSSGGWLTSNTQINLSTDLQVSGLTAAPDGSLLYSGDAGTINQALSSIAFKRQYFETTLTPDSSIFVGLFSIRACPIQIIRNSKIAVDSNLVSAPMLQEYINQPTIVNNNGQLSLVTVGGQVAASRAPFILSENLDYVIDDESSITGTCNLVQGLNEIVIPYGDLLDRSIQEQDTLVVTVGALAESYSIVKVLSADRVRVYPTPTITDTGLSFSISRLVAGKFLRFVTNSFTKTAPAPVRLWSEICYYDNGDAIEGNFGVMVGVTREDLKNAGTNIPYKSAVAGLMYALANGPTLSNLTLAIQILLGLPFSQNSGTITEINTDYRLRDDGSPLFGRILIEVRDLNNKPTGVTNIYLFPYGRQIPDPNNPGKWLPAVPEMSGIGTNPTTGRPFVVGDSVPRFTPLSLGVQVQDYLATPDWLSRLVAQGNVASQLQKYHSFQFLVNADLVSTADIDFTSQFIKKAHPHYTQVTSALLKSVEDFIDVEDSLTFVTPLNFFESVGASLPGGVKLDYDYDGSYLSVEGIDYAKYIFGDDLQTTKDSTTVSSTGGGFVSPRVGERHDSPFLYVGDLLVIETGPNFGNYQVTGVTSDTQLTVDLGSVPTNFQTQTNQSFSVYRPVRNPIFTSALSITSGNPVITTAAGLFSSGVAVGDLLVFGPVVGGSGSKPSRIYTVVEVDSNDTQVTVTPSPVEATRGYLGMFLRNCLFTKDFAVPTEYTSHGFNLATLVATTVALSSFVTFSGDDASLYWLEIAQLRPGDLMFLGADPTPYLVMSTDPDNSKIAVTPMPAASGDFIPSFQRPERPGTPISTDFLSQLPGDYLDLVLATSVSTGDRAILSAGSPDVSSTMGTNYGTDIGIVPGDYIVVTDAGSADHTRDVGYGPGIFPILAILVGGTIIRLSHNMTAGGSFRYSLLRKIANEG